MKKFILILTLYATILPAYSAGWEGQYVRINTGAILCSYFHIDDAILLSAAGDQESIAAYVASGKCVVVGAGYFYATVTKDRTAIGSGKLMEVTRRGVSMWTSVDFLKCCFVRPE